MKPLSGNRKYSGFIIANVLFTIVVIIAVFRVSPDQMNLPAFVFQLAASYSVLCGLFFGSNVLEHFSSKEGSQQQ